MRKHKGIATILMVFIVSIVALFIMSAWQARLLVSIQRNQSLSDLVNVGYKAESEIYDWIAKFIGNYPNIFNTALNGSACNLLNETGPNKLCVTGNKIGNEEILDIKASRPYASNNLQLSRKKETNSIGVSNLEIMLTLDCTSSMSEPATQAGNAACYSKRNNLALYKNCMEPNGYTTKIGELKKAALSFISSANDYAVANPTKSVKLGLILYRVDAKEIIPFTANISSVSDVITNGLGQYYDLSPLCNQVSGTTSIGSGFDLANKVLQSTQDADTKQVVVLMSDGEPNSRKDSYTGLCNNTPILNCSNNCYTEAQKFLDCSTKTTDNGGSLATTTSAYAIIVSNFITQPVKDIFMANLGTNYFQTPDATQLQTILDGIFVDIVESFTEFNIRKIIPTPLP